MHLEKSQDLFRPHVPTYAQANSPSQQSQKSTQWLLSKKLDQEPSHITWLVLLNMYGVRHVWLIGIKTSLCISSRKNKEGVPFSKRTVEVVSKETFRVYAIVEGSYARTLKVVLEKAFYVSCEKTPANKDPRTIYWKL